MILKKIKRLFIGESFEWNVTLRPDLVMKELSEKDQGTYFNSPAGMTVLVKDNKFSFYKITIGNIPMSYNHMAHMLIGKIEESKTGSRITASYRLPLFIFVLFVFLLVIPLLWSIVIIAIAIRDGHLRQGNFLLIFFPAAVFCTMNFLRKLAAKDEEKIIATIDECLEPYILSKEVLHQL